MNFCSSGATHQGGRRENQDAFLDRPDLGLWAVADGLGGHHGGAAASRAVIEALDAIPAGLSVAERLAQVRLSLDRVHAALEWEAARLGPTVVMASTVVVLLAGDDQFACLWAGDSRAYRRPAEGTLACLTRDHSVVQELIDAGSLSPEAAEDHPRAHIITRAIGDGGELVLEDVTGRLRPGDWFLLCSDGVWKELGQAELGRLTGQNAEAILAAALSRAPDDNVTAVCIAASRERLAE